MHNPNGPSVEEIDDWRDALADAEDKPRSLCYASGEVPKRGDVVVHADKTDRHPEADEVWIVTSVCGDMIRARSERAPLWKQAFYCEQMNLAKTARV